jgi:hypothetical protein
VPCERMLHKTRPVFPHDLFRGIGAEGIHDNNVVRHFRYRSQAARNVALLVEGDDDDGEFQRAEGSGELQCRLKSSHSTTRCSTFPPPVASIIWQVI